MNIIANDVTVMRKIISENSNIVSNNKPTKVNISKEFLLYNINTNINITLNI